MSYADSITSLGVFGILLAFLLLTFNLTGPKSTLYFLLNIIGAGFALYGSILIKSLPFAILEGVWTIVGLIGLLKKFLVKS